jgi:hypothetical protein
MSGRWGDRPLGRGGWRVLQPEASAVLPPVPLRSRAAKRYTGAIRPKPFYSGSPNQLPITVAILPAVPSSVDSPTGSFFSVLPATSPGLSLVPTYLRRPFAASLTHIKLLEMRRARASVLAFRSIRHCLIRCASRFCFDGRGRDFASARLEIPNDLLQ